MVYANRPEGRLAAPYPAPILDETLCAGEARDIALAMLDAAVNCHKLRNLRSYVGTQASDPEAMRSIEEHEDVRVELLELLSRSDCAGLQVHLRLTIELDTEGTSF